jgi:fructoselysine 6-kinase
MRTSTPTLFAVGDNCLDVYLTKGFMTVGGNALNVAAQWKSHGVRARYFGAVGPDQEGTITLDAIKAAELRPEDIETLPGDTAFTLLADSDGERRFLLESFGAGANYVPESLRYDELAKADWIHLGTNSNNGLVRRLVSEEVGFSLDVSTNPFVVSLAGVPLVFASGPDDPAEPVEPLIESLREAGAEKVVVTCGARGSFYHDGISVHSAGSLPVHVIDTCGAGDSFIAAFILALFFERRDPGAALRQAATRAAETCTHLGGFPQPILPIPQWLLDKHRSVIEAAQGARA